MTVLVSACLLGVPCRYDGQSKRHPLAQELCRRHRVIPVCGEIFGGLPTPRPPAEICGQRVVTREGADVTAAYRRGAEAVLELDIRLYKEESVELLSDLYSTGCEVVSEQGEVCFDRLLTRNSCKMRVGGSVSFQKPERILQICHSSGIVRLDESRPSENGLAIEGVLEVSLLYLTDDDAAPVGAISEVLPFSGTVEAEGIREDCVWQLNLGLEQLGAVMLGGGEAEVKAQLTVELLVFQPMQEEVVTSVQTQPFDLKRWEQQPGIVGYIVQPGDSLWKIAKKFHTTVDQVREMNEIDGEEAGAGARLLLIKEVTAGNCS